MYLLRIIGARRSTLAYHQCASQAELRELLAVYAALGYRPEHLVVEEIAEKQAA